MRRRREHAAAAGQRHDRRHALSASAQLHRAGLRARARERPDRASRAARSWRSSSRTKGYDWLEAPAGAAGARRVTASMIVEQLRRLVRGVRRNGAAAAPAWLRRCAPRGDSSASRRSASRRRRTRTGTSRASRRSRTRSSRCCTAPRRGDVTPRRARGVQLRRDRLASDGVREWPLRAELSSLRRAAGRRVACATSRARGDEAPDAARAASAPHRALRRRARSRRSTRRSCTTARSSQIGRTTRTSIARCTCSSSPMRPPPRALTHPRNLIVVGARIAGATWSRATSSTGDGAYFTNAVTEVLGRRWRDAAALQDAARERAGVPRAARSKRVQARDSHYISFSLRERRGAVAHEHLHDARRRRAAGTTLNGLYMLDGEQHCDHQTQVIHAAAELLQPRAVQGVLDGASHGVFNGKVYVHPDRAEDRRQADQQRRCSCPTTRADRHQAAARDLRRRREVHARRDGRPARPDGAVLSREPRHRRRDGAPAADVRVRRRRARDDRSRRHPRTIWSA